jgi:hypothetical protein
MPLQRLSHQLLSMGMVQSSEVLNRVLKIEKMSENEERADCRKHSTYHSPGLLVVVIGKLDVLREAGRGTEEAAFPLSGPMHVVKQHVEHGVSSRLFWELGKRIDVGGGSNLDQDCPTPPNDLPPGRPLAAVFRVMGYRYKLESDS